MNKYREYDILCIKDLEEAYAQMYDTVHVTLHYVTEVIDFKSFFNDHLKQFKGHSKPHVFRATKKNGFVELYTKQYKFEPEGKLQGPYQILMGYPESIPSTIEPKEIDEKHLTTVKNLVQVTERQKFASCISFWDRFFDSKGKLLVENKLFKSIDNNFFKSLKPEVQMTEVAEVASLIMLQESKKSKQTGAIDVSNTTYYHPASVSNIEIDTLVAFKNCKYKGKEKTVCKWFSFGQVKHRVCNLDKNENALLVEPWYMSKEKSLERPSVKQSDRASLEIIAFQAILLANFDVTQKSKLPKLIEDKLVEIMKRQ